MKVTILREADMAQLVRCYKSGRQTVDFRRVQAKSKRTWKQNAGVFLGGFALGSLITQCVIWLVIMCRGSGDVHVTVDLPHTPVDISVEGKMVRLHERTLTSSALALTRSTQHIQDSLLLAAILELALNNLQKDIQNEGFIVVDPDVHQSLDHTQLDLNVTNGDREYRIQLTPTNQDPERKDLDSLELLDSQDMDPYVRELFNGVRDMDIPPQMETETDMGMPPQMETETGWNSVEGIPPLQDEGI